MIYRIGICDDEQLTCSELENYINEIFECKDDEAEIYVWNSGEALKKDISNGVKIDILFLDIELLDSNGIELGKYIRNYMKNMSMNICSLWLIPVKVRGLYRCIVQHWSNYIRLLLMIHTVFRFLPDTGMISPVVVVQLYQMHIFQQKIMQN